MKTNTIHLDKTGAFLFKAPAQVSLMLNRELCIVLSLPKKHACGIALFDPEENIKELYQSLETLYQKLVDTYAADSSQIEVKIFGLRNGLRSAIEGALHWLAGNGLRIVAKDIGANATRKILVNCDSGMVGVNYAEGTSQPLQWIAEGSARNRNPMDTVHAEVLVLSESPVKRTLAKQSVEEERHWSAATPKKPLDILSKETVSDFPYPVVLLFDDLEDYNLIEAFISRVQLAYPAVQFRWVGTAVPTPLKRAFPQLKLLPPLEPDLLPEFKKKLRGAVFDHATTETNTLIPFERKRAR